MGWNGVYRVNGVHEAHEQGCNLGFTIQASLCFSTAQFAYTVYMFELIHAGEIQARV